MKYTLVNRVLFAQKKKSKLSTQNHKTVPIKKKKSQDSIIQTKKKYMEIIAQSQKE